MTTFIEFLQENPLYIAGIVFFIIFIIIALLKKAIKFLVIAVILFVGYSYFLNNNFDASHISAEPLQSLENKAKELIDNTKG